MFCFGLNFVIFQCSCRSWDCRDKDFTSPKSSLNIAIQQVLQALMIYTSKSQEWMMVLANPFLSHSLCVFLNFLLWKFLGFHFFLVEKTWIRWRKPEKTPVFNSYNTFFMLVLYVFYVGIMLIVGSNTSISGKQKHLGFKQDKNEMCCLVLENQKMQRLWEYLVLLSSAFVL